MGEPIMDSAWFSVHQSELAALCNNKSLRSLDVLVYQAILSLRDNSSGQCNPSCERITAIVSVCKRSVEQSIARLEQSGVIVVCRENGKNNSYSFPIRNHTTPAETCAPAGSFAPEGMFAPEETCGTEHSFTPAGSFAPEETCGGTLSTEATCSSLVLEATDVLPHTSNTILCGSSSVDHRVVLTTAREEPRTGFIGITLTAENIDELLALAGAQQDLFDRAVISNAIYSCETDEFKHNQAARKKSALKYKSRCSEKTLKPTAQGLSTALINDDSFAKRSTSKTRASPSNKPCSASDFADPEQMRFVPRGSAQ